MLIRRRTFLQGMAATVGMAALPRPGRTGTRGSAEDLYRWFNAEFFAWEAVLTPAERAFVSRCLRLAGSTWQYPVDEDFTYSLITFSHRVTPKGVNSARAGFGSVRAAAALRDDIAALTRARGVSPAAVPHFDRVAGVAWDAEAGHFKLYALLEDLSRIEDAELSALLVQAGDEPRHPMGLIGYTLAAGRIVEKKVYVALKSPVGRRVGDYVPRALIRHTNYMITDRRGVIAQIDLHQPVAPSILGPTGDEIANRYLNVGHSLDTLAWTGPGSYTLYFG